MLCLWKECCMIRLYMKMFNGSQYDVIGCANEKVLIGKDGKDGMWVNTDNNGLALLKDMKEQTEK